MKKIYHLIFIATFLNGCFVLDFNKDARIAGYSKGSIAEFRILNAESGFVEPEYQKGESKTYSNNKIVQILLNEQKIWSNTPYKTGGNSVSGSDCSGFTQTIFREKFNKQITRVTLTQMEEGKRIYKQSDLRPGDLVFFKSGRGANGWHVGIYIENGDFVHISTKSGAKIANLNNKYWQKIYKRATRIL